MPKLSIQRWLVFVCLAAALLSTACAGPWQKVPNRIEEKAWSIRAPKGWMRLSLPDSEMLSKNGPYLEYILIQSRPVTEKFRYTRQNLTTDMLPHEAAQLIIDNLRSDPLIRGFRLLSSEPAILAGEPGFKLTFTYRDKNDVEAQTVYYGVVLPDMFFNLRYTAARRYYFAQELSTFSSVLDSLQFLPRRTS